MRHLRNWAGAGLPILNVFDEAGVDVCYELHPGEDLHDGVTFERFLKGVNDHKRANILYDPSHMVLQQLDYLEFLDFYHDRVRAFHVKDAEFRPNGRSGVYGGYQDWIDRAGRFRSLGDGQIDFKAIFSKMAQYDYPGWAVLEWECCIKHPKVGASEGAALIKEWIIRVTEKAFDDFAGSGADAAKNRKILGLQSLNPHRNRIGFQGRHRRGRRNECSSRFVITVFRNCCWRGDFSQPGFPATGLRRWGGSKSHLALRPGKAASTGELL